VESDKNNWRAIKKDHLLAYSSFVKMTLSSRDVQECREALERYCFNFPVFKKNETKQNHYYIILQELYFFFFFSGSRDIS